MHTSERCQATSRENRSREAALRGDGSPPCSFLFPCRLSGPGKGGPQGPEPGGNKPGSGTLRRRKSSADVARRTLDFPAL
eukprot:1075652-Pyramimonas_sp.AAC.1